MNQYETDDEKVEAIKKWWKDNGVSVIAGVAIGLGGVFGWRAWINHSDQVAGEASAVFEQLLSNANGDQTEAAVKQANTLTEEFASTPYAALGSLVEAKALYDSGNAAGAIAALERAIAEAPDPALAQIAALRLARVQVSEGQLDAAQRTVEAHDNGGSFAGDFAVVRGDIAAARGDASAARADYEKAIDAGTGLPQLVRLKLDNLPAAQ